MVVKPKHALWCQAATQLLGAFVKSLHAKLLKAGFGLSGSPWGVFAFRVWVEDSGGGGKGSETAAKGRMRERAGVLSK